MQGPHLYASSNWVRDKTRQDAGPGEETAAKKYFLTGRNPPIYRAQCRVGSDDAWTNGLSVSVLDEPLQDLPACCAAPVAVFTGLSPAGETTFVYFKRPLPPPPFPDFTFTLSGIANAACADCASLNTDFVLNCTGTSTWESNTFTICATVTTTWNVHNGLLGLWYLECGGLQVSYRANNPAWDKKSPITFSAFGGVPSAHCAFMPNSITIAPIDVV